MMSLPLHQKPALPQPPQVERPILRTSIANVSQQGRILKDWLNHEGLRGELPKFSNAGSDDMNREAETEWPYHVFISLSKQSRPRGISAKLVALRRQ